MSPSVLALDFGTTNFKAAVIDASGRIECLHRAASPIVHYPDGRAEMPVERFERAVSDAIAALRAHRSGGLAEVRAVTFSTQANTFVLLDAAERPITPFIIWNDTRARPRAELWRQWAAEPGFSEQTGLPVLDESFSACKLKWVSEQNGEWWGRTGRLGFLSDYFTRWFTGHWAGEGSVAALSGLFDVPGWRWSPWLCERSGVPVEWLPPVVRSGTVVGGLRADIAGAFGLPADCVFVAGCLDQYAGAIGVGNVNASLISETTGTVLASVRRSSHFAAPRAAAGSTGAMVVRGPAAEPGVFYHMAVGELAGNLLGYYQACLPDPPSPEALDQAAARESGAGDLSLDPSWSLEQCQAHLRAWVAGEPRGRVVRCIYETVAKALAEQVAALRGEAPVAAIHSAGGGARSRLWLQIKAEVLGLPVVAPAGPEPTLIGAGALAAGALGWQDFANDRLCPPPERVIHPRG